MAGVLVRQFGWQKSNSPSLQKSTALLSDGVTRVVVVVDQNQTGVTGDGGDNTGVPKAYVYTSPNGTTWTLRATLTISQQTGNRPMASMSIDSANNIHFVWRDTNGALQFVLFTFGAGPTYTAGSTVQVAAAPPTNEQFVRVDIDVLGTSTRSVVAAYYNRSVATKSYRMKCYIRNAGSTWTNIVDDLIKSGDQRLTYTDDFGLACDQTAIAADNLSTFCIAIQRRDTAGTDYGDIVTVYRVNIATPAVTATTVSPVGALNTGLGSGYRVYRVFNTATDTYVVAAAVGAVQPAKGFIYKFSYNRVTPGYTTIVPPTLSGDMIPNKPYSLSQYVTGGFDRTSDPINWIDMAYAQDRVLFIGHNEIFSVSAVAKIAGSTATWSVNKPWDGSYQPSSVPPKQVWAGTPRNYSTQVLPVIISYTNTSTTNAYRLEYREKLTPSVPTVTAPGVGSTVSTDLPTLSAKLKWPENSAQLRVKAQWQLATDAGFTTNLRTVTEGELDYVSVDNTNAPATNNVVNSEVTPALSELFQTTWYIRAREIDEWGAMGSYSTANNFLVTHPPVGANLYPNSQALFVYGTGDITFSWVFTDPSPTDVQTAYRVLVEDNDLNTVIVDSGKIASAVPSGVVNIPVGGKDINLRWRLTLWDSDDVAGPQSSAQLFSVTDSPTPTITTPASAAVLTTAIPVISWTPGLGGVKYQKSFRVIISQGSNTVYTTGWVSSALTTITVPVGYLMNSSSYTITVYVRDNYDLEGQVSIPVSTSWTPPASRSLAGVNLSEFAKRGFVWVTFDPTGADTDFAGFVIYRRQYGESTWTSVATSTKLTDIVGIQDYLVGSGVTYEYAMTQLVDRFGDIVESTIVEASKITVTPRAEGYWLLDLVDSADSIPLYNVTAEEFTEEYEQETYHVIGRGRHVDYGDRLGYSGSMSAQLRDRFLNGVQKINYATNPSLTYVNPGPTPNGWAVTTTGTVGTITEEQVQTRDASPAGRLNAYRVTAGGLGSAATDTVLVSQLILLDGAILTGDTCTFSIWVNDVDGDLSGKRLEIGIRWETAANALVTDSFTQSPAVVETYSNSNVNSPDYGNGAAIVGHWDRYSVSATRPATATQARVRIQMEGIGSGTTAAKKLVVTGAQFEKGSLTNYFDGAAIGSNWIGPEELGTSETSGYYKARNQRTDLEAMKSKRQSIYLRSPFGDIWQVAPGNIGVSRIAGTGQTEFTDVTIPYEEVAF